MRILVAEDNLATQKLVEALLVKLGHEVHVVADGMAAWNLLEHQGPDTPRVALLDWEMPRMQGPDLCRRVRSAELPIEPYLLLVTSRATREDLLAGLRAGADDYLAKPFDPAELQTRVSVGVRMVQLREELLRRQRELEAANEALAEARQFVPLCASCGKLREDKEFWSAASAYLDRLKVKRASAGICPACTQVRQA